MEKVVFTNGCFDVIHPGHIDLLRRARALGTKLIVGINSDASVKRIKGNARPIFSETDRAATLREFRFVDEVHIFEESTPENLIKKIKPDVLVKGGDWKKNEIIGADFVESYGGEVFSIPLTEGFSSTAVIEKTQAENTTRIAVAERKDETAIVENSIRAHQQVIEQMLAGEAENIERCAEIIYGVFETGNKILICGNGGSAADAQHIAAEFVGRYETERKALPAIALTTDTSALTALANDYDFERIFARQVEALARKGDLLLAISTSGNSPNVSQAVMTARQMNCRTLAMTGASGKKLASLCDDAILIPAERTARIQEAHILVAHIWCEMIDRKFND